MSNKAIYKKILIIVSIILVFYYFSSILIFRGEFMPTHHYSFENMIDSKEKNGFVSNNLNMSIQGDSLLNIHNLKSRFYTTKSMYEKFYGFLIHTNNEKKNYRRLKWEESKEVSGNRNWIITNVNGKYIGAAFYSGYVDAKIGDTVQLIILNRKTNKRLGNIKILIK